MPGFFMCNAAKPAQINTLQGYKKQNRLSTYLNNTTVPFLNIGLPL